MLDIALRTKISVTHSHTYFVPLSSSRAKLPLTPEGWEEGAGMGFLADVGQEALASDALEGEVLLTQLLEQFLLTTEHPQGSELLGGSCPKRTSF